MHYITSCGPQESRQGGAGRNRGGTSNSGKKWESADKPGSVEGSHSSGTIVTERLKQPTRVRCGPHHAPLFGLAPDGVYLATDCCQPRGALLPHLFTLACAPANRAIGGLFSAALSVGSRRPGVTWRPALWSPDFPPHLAMQRLPGRLPSSLYAVTRADARLFNGLYRDNPFFHHEAHETRKNGFCTTKNTEVTEKNGAWACA